MRVKTLPIFLAFFLMGLADAMGPMSDGAKKQYELSNLVATLLFFFVFIAFALFSISGGLTSGSSNLAIPGIVAASLGFANIWPMSFKPRISTDPR